MSEDKTFRILQRKSYEEMLGLWMTSGLSYQVIFKKTEEKDIRPDLQEFFAKHGWTYLELADQYNKRNNGN